MYLAAGVEQAEQHFIRLLGEGEGADAKTQQDHWEVWFGRHHRGEKVGDRSRAAGRAGHRADQVLLGSADSEQETKPRQSWQSQC